MIRYRSQSLTNRSVQFQILVGAEEGASVQSSIIKEVERELKTVKKSCGTLCINWCREWSPISLLFGTLVK